MIRYLYQLLICTYCKILCHLEHSVLERSLAAPEETEAFFRNQFQLENFSDQDSSPGQAAPGRSAKLPPPRDGEEPEAGRSGAFLEQAHLDANNQTWFYFHVH